jgi:hypothetical protein
MENRVQASLLPLQPIGPCTTLPLLVTAMARWPGPCCRCSELRDYKRKKVPVDDREIHKVVTNSDSTRNGLNARAACRRSWGVWSARTRGLGPEGMG